MKLIPILLSMTLAISVSASLAADPSDKKQSKGWVWFDSVSNITASSGPYAMLLHPGSLRAVARLAKTNQTQYVRVRINFEPLGAETLLDAPIQVVVAHYSELTGRKLTGTIPETDLKIDLEMNDKDKHLRDLRKLLGAFGIEVLHVGSTQVKFKKIDRSKASTGTAP